LLDVSIYFIQLIKGIFENPPYSTLLLTTITEVYYNGIAAFGEYFELVYFFNENDFGRLDKEFQDIKVKCLTEMNN
jgi:hypothetical protein